MIKILIKPIYWYKEWGINRKYRGELKFQFGCKEIIFYKDRELTKNWPRIMVTRR